MSPEKLRRIVSIAKALRKQVERADQFELELNNGSSVGALISSLASELEVMAEKWTVKTK